MSKYYYITPQGQQAGPVDENLLRGYGVSANTMVWTRGMAQWERAGKVLPPNLLAQEPMTPPQAPFGQNPNPYGHQPYGQNPYGQQQPYGGRPWTHPQGPCPPNYLVWAILTTIFCCMPAGIVSIVYSCKVESAWRDGRQADAESNSKNAGLWAVVSAIISLIVWIGYFVFLFLVGGAFM